VIAPPALPKEHGAWAMLALPLLLGLSLGGGRAAAWGVPVAALLAFLAHYAWVPVIQRKRSGKPGPVEWTRSRWIWGALYLGSAGLAFAATLLVSPSPGAVAEIALVSGTCAAVYFVAAAFGSGRLIVSELVGMAGMALSAPLIAAAAGTLDRRAWTAAAIAYAYFLSSVAFVRAYGAFREDRAGATVRCLLAHAGVAAGALTLVWGGFVAAPPFLALAPAAMRTVRGLIRPPENLRILGKGELVVVLILAAAAIPLLRFGGA
jgi:hypothetical protein